MGLRLKALSVLAVAFAAQVAFAAGDLDSDPMRPALGVKNTSANAYDLGRKSGKYCAKMAKEEAAQAAAAQRQYSRSNSGRADRVD